MNLFAKKRCIGPNDLVFLGCNMGITIQNISMLWPLREEEVTRFQS